MDEIEERARRVLEFNEEAMLRRYEARWSFYKVVVGTALVGIIAAALPFWIQLIQEQTKRNNDYRSFITEYIDNGISEEIELRIRFAEYFSHLTEVDDPSKSAWQGYYAELVKRREEIQAEINDLERQRAKLIADGNEDLSEKAQIELAELDRNLSWAYGEVGYARSHTNIDQRSEQAESSDVSPVISYRDYKEYLSDFEAFLNTANLKHITASDLMTLGASNSAGSRCENKNNYPPRELWGNVILLASTLDAIVEELGVPMRLTSVYRSPEYNGCLQGTASRSFHMQFKAADFQVEGKSPGEVARVAKRLRSQGVFSGGIGIYNTFVHVDVRGYVDDWDYTLPLALRDRSNNP